MPDTHLRQQTFSAFGGEMTCEIHYTGTEPIAAFSERLAGAARRGNLVITGEGATLYRVKLDLYLPMRDVYRTFTGDMGMWNGQEIVSIALGSGWDYSTNRFSPIICDYNRRGRNTYTYGLLRTRDNANIGQGMPTTHRGLPMRETQIVTIRDWPEGMPVGSGHEEPLFFCDADLHWHDAVRLYVSAHEELHGKRTWPVPEAAYEPVWCSWYAHLEDMTSDMVRKELPFIREAGFGVVLIDAPWFGSANHLEYSGDYVPNENFQDMPQLIEDIHGHDLKAVLWCAPSMVGQKSEAWNRLLPNLFSFHEGRPAMHICHGRPEGRQHMAETCARLMRDYNLDGLKLDFMDGPKGQCKGTHEHDIAHFGEAVYKAFEETRDAILEVKNDALIEYRHRYANVTTRDLATGFRGNDGPYDADYIRRQNIRLRTFVPEGAVHSDYGYWHPEESLENIERMMASMVFTGVPTLSVNLSYERPESFKLVKDWLTFYREHLDGLAKGTMRVLSPDNMASVSVSEGNAKAYVSVFSDYAPREIDLGEAKPEEVYVFDGTAEGMGEMEIKGDERVVPLRVSCLK